MTSTELTEVVTGEVVSLASEMKIINDAIRRAEKASEAHSKAFVVAQNTGEDSKLEVGNSLLRIHSGELWREDGARSWSGWIKAGGAEAVAFFGGRAHADRLVNHAAVVAELAPKTGIGANSTGELKVEHTRELKKVPEEQREEVIERAAETGKITGKAIKDAAAEVQAGTPRRGPDPKPGQAKVAAWKGEFLKALKIAVAASSPEEVLAYAREKLQV